MKGPKLGELITYNEPRDAIHIAVAPVTNHTDYPIKPGDFVCFAIPGNTELVVTTTPENAIGIIDPFLQVQVKPGEHCWMFVMPNTITGLRHEWTHPAFDEDLRATSEWWLRDFAAKLPSYGHLPFEQFMTMMMKNGGVYLGVDINYPTNEEIAQLKKHFKIVTGVDLPEKPEFGCAC